MSTVNGRESDYPIEPLFLERWSPRAFTGAPIPLEALMTLFEAAHWAPSAFNAQPWRFLFARRDTVHWEKFLGLLSPRNQLWAGRAAALIIVLSRTTMLPAGAEQEVPSPTHSFDAGAAWACLALQAIRSGWHAHGMAGFDRERAAIELEVPANHRVEIAIAVGRRGEPSVLPEQMQGLEKPNSRKPLEALVFEGKFPA